MQVMSRFQEISVYNNTSTDRVIFQQSIIQTEASNIPTLFNFMS